MTTTEKLLILADYLEHHVQDEEFDLREWHCETIACAIGHAASCPDLAARGLSLDHSRGGEPTFQGFRGWAAVQFFFNLLPEEASELFDWYYYPIRKNSKAHVIDRIRQFASERSEDPKTTPESS